MGAFLPMSSCAAAREAGIPELQWSVRRAAGAAGTPLFPGPLWCMRLRLGASRPRAARRGSAVGYFNERCQGLQRGEERREKPSTLSKLGVGRGGLARCCGAASVTHSAPAGPLRLSGSGYGGFFPLSPLSLSCSSLSLTFAAFVCAGWGMGGDLGGETALSL